MLFNSLDFAIFLPIVFVFYWFIFNKNLKLQNLLIVASSYFFYGWWDYRFLLLILFSSVLDYLVGFSLAKEENKNRRMLFLWTSIVVNLGFLGFFKYYNFFLDSFSTAFSFFGTAITLNSLNIILPVGISFYTFQTLSYTIDVYKRKLEPTKNFIAFSAFVSFFPQLVAGPIERATNLLPQFYTKRKFSYEKAVDGMHQILWGLFKKIVIADNCAVFVNNVFENYTSFGGGQLFLGSVFFAVQIYCDFSGYSDIAIGVSRLFGFKLMRNFSFPYFSRDIAEFWRRWHISLSTWFRDYLYFPLGGSRGGLWMKIRNTFIIFVVSGFWHGANWTFIVWGALNAIYFLPLLLLKRNRSNLDIVAQNGLLPNFKELIQISFTFFLTLIAWVFFRSESVSNAFDYLNLMLVKSPFFKINELIIMSKSFFTQNIAPLLILFIVVEWLQRNKNHALEKINIKYSVLRWGFYLFLVMSILLFGVWSEQDFIYFQF